MRRATLEYLVLGALALVAAAWLLPVLLAERSHLRDDARRQAVAQTRRQIEDFYNRNERYPLSFAAPAGVRYVATEQTGSAALGYFIETKLEANLGEAGGFDEGEDRKYYYLILRQGSDIVYRVCGGDEKQCEPC